MMRKTTRAWLTSAFAGAALLAAVPVADAAAPTTPRADDYVEIWCTTSDQAVYLAKRVNARAIQPEKEPGGKDTATDRYNENNRFGEKCG